MESRCVSINGRPFYPRFPIFPLSLKGAYITTWSIPTRRRSQLGLTWPTLIFLPGSLLKTTRTSSSADSYLLPFQLRAVNVVHPLILLIRTYLCLPALSSLDRLPRKWHHFAKPRLGLCSQYHYYRLPAFLSPTFVSLPSDNTPIGPSLTSFSSDTGFVQSWRNTHAPSPDPPTRQLASGHQDRPR